MQKISEKTLQKIESYFHQLITERAIKFIKVKGENLEFPKLTTELNSQKWFPVSGMYGGFSYTLIFQNTELTLIVESWSRVVGGSGQKHQITTNGIKLLEEGFV
jgi:hypothetical protein